MWTGLVPTHVMLFKPLVEVGGAIWLKARRQTHVMLFTLLISYLAKSERLNTRHVVYAACLSARGQARDQTHVMLFTPLV